MLRGAIWGEKRCEEDNPFWPSVVLFIICSLHLRSTSPTRHGVRKTDAKSYPKNTQQWIRNMNMTNAIYICIVQLWLFLSALALDPRRANLIQLIFFVIFSKTFYYTRFWMLNIWHFHVPHSLSANLLIFACYLYAFDSFLQFKM